jgi:hypothetical protein
MGGARYKSKNCSTYDKVYRLEFSGTYVRRPIDIPSRLYIKAHRVTNE